jgi:hypothetical protein
MSTVKANIYIGILWCVVLLEGLVGEHVLVKPCNVEARSQPNKSLFATIGRPISSGTFRFGADSGDHIVRVCVRNWPIHVPTMIDGDTGYVTVHIIKEQCECFQRRKLTQ